MYYVVSWEAANLLSRRVALSGPKYRYGCEVCATTIRGVGRLMATILRYNSAVPRHYFTRTLHYGVRRINCTELAESVHGCWYIQLNVS